VQYVVSLLIASLCYFYIARFLSFNILFCFLALYACSLFYMLCVFLFCFGYCFSSCIQLSPIFEQVYRTLPPGGNSVSVNKYHIGTMEHGEK
jgi:hypothetical protein